MKAGETQKPGLHLAWPSALCHRGVHGAEPQHLPCPPPVTPFPHPAKHNFGAKRQVSSFQREDLRRLQVLILFRPTALRGDDYFFFFLTPPPPRFVLNLAVKRVRPCSGRSRWPRTFPRGAAALPSSAPSLPALLLPTGPAPNSFKDFAG